MNPKKMAQKFIAATAKRHAAASAVVVRRNGKLVTAPDEDDEDDAPPKRPAKPTKASLAIPKPSRKARAEETDEDDEDTGPVPYSTGKASKASAKQSAKTDDSGPEQLPPYLRGYCASACDNLRDIAKWANSFKAMSPAIAETAEALAKAVKALDRVSGEDK